MKNVVILLLVFCGGIGVAKVLETNRATRQIKERRHNLSLRRPLQEGPVYGGILRWGTSNPPKIFNPVLTTHSVSASLMELVFDSLVRINGEGEVVPSLAEAWTISEDHRVYTFRLREDVFFHDGQPLTADDVVFTYQAIIDHANDSGWRFNLNVIKEIRAVDPRTVRIVLKEPSTNLLYYLVREVVPRHLLAGVDLETASFNYHPVGSGPFRFKSWDRQTNRIVLEANPDYFQGRPYLDAIEVVSFPDFASLWKAFMREEIDLIQFMDRPNFLVVQKDPVFKAFETVGGAYYALAYNTNDPVLSDIRVRRALAKTINKQEVITYILGGRARVSWGPFSQGSPRFNTDIPFLPYNPREALLDLGNLGWADRDGDRFLEKDGQTFELRVLIDDRSEMLDKIGATIRKQLAEIGVKLIPIFYHTIDDLDERFLKKYRPQAWLRLYYGDSIEPEMALQEWVEDNNLLKDLNWYRNDRLDRLVEMIRETTDPDQRNALFRRAHALIYQDQPACFLFYPTALSAVARKFKNVEEYFTPYMPIYTMKNWYIREDYVREEYPY